MPEDATVEGLIVGDAMVLAGVALRLDGMVSGSIRNRGGEVRFLLT